MSPRDRYAVDPMADRRMSSGTKLVIGLVVGGTLCVLACCGSIGLGINWIFSGVSRMAIQDPEKIRQLTAEIVDINIPDELSPQVGTDFFGATRTVVYGNANGSMLTLYGFSEEVTGETEAEKEQMRQMLAEEGNYSAHLKNVKTEIREFTIGGETVKFEFTQGEQDGIPEAVRQVNGVFRGKNGPVMLMLMVPEEEYDEEAVIEMIESIRN